MDVHVTTTMPEKYLHLKPISSYETRYIWTGFGRYDVNNKVWIQLQEIPNGMRITKVPCENPVFRNAFHTELVYVTVYPGNVWSEQITPDEIYYYFPQQPMSL
jgi:hypothetical protein